MSNWKTQEQLTHEIFASIERVPDRDDWLADGFENVYTNNGLIFRIFFNKEQMEAAYVINSYNFVFEKATYMVNADDELDAQLKANILQGTLQAMFWWHCSKERFDMMDVLQPSIQRWEERLSEREQIAQTG